MPNQPGSETVTVSFTLPRKLAAAVQDHAKKKLTNKSDIIRRALLAYLPEDEANAILTSMMEENGDPPRAAPDKPKPVKYTTRKSKRSNATKGANEA